MQCLCQAALLKGYRAANDGWLAHVLLSAACRICLSNGICSAAAGDGVVVAASHADHSPAYVSLLYVPLKSEA